MNKKESKIVRVTALQSLFELAQQYPTQQQAFDQTIHQLKNENTPSITARIKKLIG